ncbi:hypothetical protein HPP92_006571 [Vanilla planifolia]|uniref:BZIP domain-containing protein n=1 Tax=Vanilla planifolia TaxID=51239 RepID=A0A835RP46_VANPL|nr:hypothetical protein HPP92_006571 [Vanilla planifolia]
MNAESFGGVSSMDYGSTSSNLGDSDLRAMINEILQMDVGIDWGHFPADTSAAEQFEQRVYQSPLTIGNPMVGSGNIALEGGPGRGAKRSPPIANLEESAASKKQMRKIKNREQAALSRERVKAYVASLESRVARLKKENAALKMEKLLMEKTVENLFITVLLHANFLGLLERTSGYDMNSEIQ